MSIDCFAQLPTVVPGAAVSENTFSEGEVQREERERERERERDPRALERAVEGQPSAVALVKERERV